MRTGRFLPPSLVSLKSADIKLVPGWPPIHGKKHCDCVYGILGKLGAQLSPEGAWLQVLGFQSCLSIGMKLSSSPSIPTFLHYTAGADMSSMSLSPWVL